MTLSTKTTLVILLVFSGIDSPVRLSFGDSPDEYWKLIEPAYVQRNIGKLEEMSRSHDDTIALYAYWLLCEFRQKHHLEASEVDFGIDCKDEMMRFIGFFEGRRRIEIPHWWKCICTEGKYFGNTSGILFPSPSFRRCSDSYLRDTKYAFEYQHSTFRSAAPISILKPGILVVSPKGVRHEVDLNGELSKGDNGLFLRGATRYLVAANDTQVYFYRHDIVPNMGDLTLYDPQKGIVVWQQTVFAHDYSIVAPGGTTGPAELFVHLDVGAPGIARIWGASSVGVFFEEFRTSDGCPTMRFSSKGWSRPLLIRRAKGNDSSIPVRSNSRESQSQRPKLDCAKRGTKKQKTISPINPSVSRRVAMEMQLIPAGEFVMGIQETDSEFIKIFPREMTETVVDERPTHRVKFAKAFYLGRHEVKVGQFREFVAATNYCTDAERTDGGIFVVIPGTGSIRKRLEYNWRNPGWTQKESEPVVGISHNDATAFCEWLSRVEKQKYRLPSEAEWEYACRAGTSTRYFNGNDPEGVFQVGNIFDASANVKFQELVSTKAKDGYVFTAPAGSFKSNAFGLFDMHGNVWEWCSDWYGEKYYSESGAEGEPKGPVFGTERVLRGGSWHSWSLEARSSCRHMSEPGNAYQDVGFRVARDLE